ncbi:hypothetical protein HML84_03740 [Alcanivorax sp. IO_7]|nr:hypothetical protein HML84_03740 [Alcanivorax sp. IO_7]
MFIAFVGGAFVVLTKTFPYPLFNDAHKAARAVLKQNTLIDLYTQSDLWREARREDRGVTVHDPDRAYQGLTLYTSGDGSHADLVNMDGEVLHRWALPYSEVWDQTPQAGRHARTITSTGARRGYSQRRPAGDLHRQQRYPLGLWPGAPERGFGSDLGLPRQHPPRPGHHPGRRRGRPHP